MRQYAFSGRVPGGGRLGNSRQEGGEGGEGKKGNGTGEREGGKDR